NTGAILSALKLNSSITNGQEYSGKNAMIDYNGAKDIEFSSNNFRLQGIEFSLNSANVGETVTVNVATDVDAVVEKVTTFVNEYNSLISDIGKTLGEATYRDYSPLTDAQKEELTDKQIELWEEKAKSGLLRNDSIINTIQQNIKSALLQDVKLSDGTTINLHSIGIQTKGYSSAATSGELQIDEDKLRAAITNNPNGVLELFFATPSDSDLNTSDRNLSSSQVKQKREQSGLFNCITDVMVNGIGQIINKAGAGNSANNYRKVNSFILLDFTTGGSKSLLDNRLIDINKRITSMNTRMAKVEARYWSQFTAMETAIGKLQSQQSALGLF
ncbi:MAG: flagellar filament capping protein FliD, partial [Turicibacter sp.]|nr:flagellar filament capping protein FliD [Turicibacter sp.]